MCFKMETNRKEYIRECLKKYYQSPKYKKSSKEITKKLSKGKGQVYEWNEAGYDFVYASKKLNSYLIEAIFKKKEVE